MQLQYSLVTVVTLALFAFATPIYDDCSEIYETGDTEDMISLPESGQIVFGALQQWDADSDTIAFDMDDGDDVAILEDWKNEVVKQHNAYRAHYGAASLTWSDALYPGTQQWAQQCKFQHSNGNGAYGENLAAGTGTTYGFSNGLKDWMDEACKRVVWKNSKQVACAVANCRAGTIFQQASKNIVCRYSPPGNFAGRYPENVGRFKK
ncbi:CAP domain-containing protein [Infundibulicybe gibba]|nr:CAP domain-containing protein [Infundibulicybe gibba]